MEVFAANRGDLRGLPCSIVKLPTGSVEICGGDESAPKLRRKISEPWLAKLPVAAREADRDEVPRGLAPHAAAAEVVPVGAARGEQARLILYYTILCYNIVNTILCYNMI